MRTSPLHLVPPAWTDAVNQFETTMRAAGHRPATIATRLRHINYLARTIKTPPEYITATTLLEWAGHQHWAPETRHGYYTSIRALYRALGTTPSPADALPQVKRPVPPPHPTPEDVYRRALDAAGPRTRAILILAGSLGLRRSEIAQVHATDLTDTPDGPTLTVHAKGGHDRVLPLTLQLAALIRATTASSPDG